MDKNIVKITEKAKALYPAINFKTGSEFCWSPQENVVIYPTVVNNNQAMLFLHELAHAILNHQDFKNDLELIKHENEAWQHAKRKLAPKFNLSINEDFIQDHLDTYRDWLSDRSCCPKCQQSGLQTDRYTYECLNCSHAWEVNEARTCRLRRYSPSKQK